MAEFISKRGQSIAAGSDYKHADAVENRDATHRDILKFGSKIYERKCAELEKLHEQSLAELEERIWHLANKDKELAVKETFQQGQEQLQKLQEDCKKEKEKAVKAECKRVEAYMKKQAMLQLQEADDAFKLRLKDVIHNARIEFEVEKMLAMKQVREEEIDHATEEATKLADLEDKKRNKLTLEAEKDKSEALKKLKLKMEQDLEAAVKKTEHKSREMFRKEMEKCEEKHLAEMETTKKEIELWQSKYESLKVQLSETENIQKKTEMKLREVVHEFQQFINLTNGFSHGQSEFLLPDVNLLEDMLKGAVSSCKK